MQFSVPGHERVLFFSSHIWGKRVEVHNWTTWASVTTWKKFVINLNYRPLPPSCYIIAQRFNYCFGSWVRNQRSSPCFKMPARRPECLQWPDLVVLLLITHFALFLTVSHQATPGTPNGPIMSTTITAIITDITKRNSSLTWLPQQETTTHQSL